MVDHLFQCTGCGLVFGPETAEAKVQALITERDKLRKLDQEAATYVESVLCMRTDFSGDPPYVGWKGLGLALNEALDKRDKLRSENHDLKIQLTALATV